MQTQVYHHATAHHRYKAECFGNFHDNGERCRTPQDRCGRKHKQILMWEVEADNLVTTVGLTKYLDATLKTGLASPTWYVGLVDNASFSAYAVGDTSASHAGWIEGVPYSDATRKAFTPGSITGTTTASVDNSASKASFTINASLTVRGAFLIDNSTKSGTTGSLLGEADFGGGSRAVISGDTLNVTVTCTQT